MKKACFLALIVVAPFVGAVAAPFQNLGFDEANTNNVIDLGDGAFFGFTTELLPGWTLLSGGGTEPVIGLNAFGTGHGYATIASTNGQSSFNILIIDGYPMSGPYHLHLSPSIDRDTGEFLLYSLMQTGDVPLDAVSLRFVNYGNPFAVYLNGNEIALTYDYVPGPFFFDLFPAFVAGDISAFAGQTVELKFVTLTAPQYSLNGLDGIFFSTVPIPEPSTYALLLLGVVSVACVRRLRFRASRSP